MKAWMIVLLVVAALAVFLVIVVNQWCATPHGRLDWRAAVMLKYIRAAKIELFRESDPPEESRRINREKSRPFKSGPPDLAGVVDREVPGPDDSLPMRIYTPKSGTVLPTAVDDAYAAILWVSGNAGTFGGDPARVAVAGDSAGANLTAVVSQLVRDRQGPRLAGQVLFYPATDESRFDTKSHVDFAEGYYLTRKCLEIFRSLYAPDRADWTSSLVSPLLAPSLANLPPAVVVTAGFDPLRDEGEAYAERLEASGVPVVRKRYEGILHGFLTLDRLFPQADDAISLAADELKRLFGQ